MLTSHETILAALHAPLTPLPATALALLWQNFADPMISRFPGGVLGDS